MKKSIIKKFLLTIVGILLIIFSVKYDIGIPCLIQKATSFYCPGCGITRAIKSLISLDFYQAIRYNALVVIILPILIFYFIYTILLNKRDKIPNSVWCFLLIIVVSFGIIRNIPAFSFLAPTLI